PAQMSYELVSGSVADDHRRSTDGGRQPENEQPVTCERFAVPFETAAQHHDRRRLADPQGHQILASAAGSPEQQQPWLDVVDLQAEPLAAGLLTVHIDGSPQVADPV